MKTAIAILTLFLSHLALAGDIVCDVNTSMGPAHVRINSFSVSVTGAALKTTHVIPVTSWDYDGHMTTLATGRTLAVSFEDWYGCIHNARITTLFRDDPQYIESVDAAQCRGGEMSDSACHIPN